MTDQTSDQSFLEDLERVAKGLSVVTDQASVDDLRRLFDQLQGEGGAGDVLRSDDEPSRDADAK
ncbi:hypothetical protein [Aureimonas sp. Leaf454]|uniref:hypothetical protein n=1 Tax=Aureimonas sp. Leaf454 TaxID=1736381 RepID=UPI000A52F6E5|nr:hypothetical protein [Aureimonas sp. Leaf454]